MYDVMRLPPSLGVDHDTLTCPFPGATVSPAGADGAVASTAVDVVVAPGPPPSEPPPPKPPTVVVVGPDGPGIPVAEPAGRPAPAPVPFSVDPDPGATAVEGSAT